MLTALAKYTRSESYLPPFPRTYYFPSSCYRTFPEAPSFLRWKEPEAQERPWFLARSRRSLAPGNQCSSKAPHQRLSSLSSVSRDVNGQWSTDHHPQLPPARQQCHYSSVLFGDRRIGAMERPFRRVRTGSPPRNLPILQQRNDPPIFQTLRRRRLGRSLRRYWKAIAIIAAALLIEVFFHVRSFNIARPATNLDPPFYTGCQDPILNTTERANAALVMLARNADVDDAVKSVKSLQTQFNQHFGYPWVFLNDKEFSPTFKYQVNKAVRENGGAETSFETIPSDMWGYPPWIDQDAARASMDSMAKRKISYANKESYHHMCRFNSG